MARKKRDVPDERCLYCQQDLPCEWTVTVGNMLYPMCIGCSNEAAKDFFSYSMRKPEDRQESKGEGTD